MPRPVPIHAGSRTASTCCTTTAPAARPPALCSCCSPTRRPALRTSSFATSPCASPKRQGCRRSKAAAASAVLAAVPGDCTLVAAQDGDWCMHGSSGAAAAHGRLAQQLLSCAAMAAPGCCAEGGSLLECGAPSALHGAWGPQVNVVVAQVDVRTSGRRSGEASQFSHMERWQVGSPSRVVFPDGRAEGVWKRRRNGLV